MLGKNQINFKILTILFTFVSKKEYIKSNTHFAKVHKEVSFVSEWILLGILILIITIKTHSYSSIYRWLYSIVDLNLYT